MDTSRWILLSLSLPLTALAFASCDGGDTTTGTGGSTSSTSSGTGGEGGKPPYKCLSEYSDFPVGECDLFDQDCPPGRTCKPAFADGMYTTKCVLTTGLKSLGERCYDENECDAKLQCIGTGNYRYCTLVCCPGDNDTCYGGTCNLNFGADIYSMTVCSFAPECQLLTPNACPPGLGCHVESKGLATCVGPSGNVSPVFGPCEFINDCDGMQHCYGSTPAKAGTCYYYCAPGDTTSPPGLGGCPAGSTCKKLLTEFPDLGVCFPDPNDGGMDGGGGMGGSGGMGGMAGNGGMGGAGGAMSSSGVGGAGGAMMSSSGVGGAGGGASDAGAMDAADDGPTDAATD